MRPGQGRLAVVAEKAGSPVRCRVHPLSACRCLCRILRRSDGDRASQTGDLRWDLLSPVVLPCLHDGIGAALCHEPLHVPHRRHSHFNVPIRHRIGRRQLFRHSLPSAANRSFPGRRFPPVFVHQERSVFRPPLPAAGDMVRRQTRAKRPRLRQTSHFHGLGSPSSLSSWLP